MIVDVEDLNIGSLRFSKSYDSNRNRRGKNLYSDNCVNIEQVDENGDKVCVDAKVEGNYGDYTVKLEIHGDHVEKYYCSCMDFDTGNICKHILATCMEVINPHGPSTEERKISRIEEERRRNEAFLKAWEERKKEDERRREYERKYGSALMAIRRFKNDDEISEFTYKSRDRINLKELYLETRNNLNTAKGSTELSYYIGIEPIVHFLDNETIDVSFKIGETTKYVIKDIEEFCEAFKTSKTLQYGKKLKFVSDKENFRKEDRKLLDFILEFGEILKYNKQLIEDYRGYYAPKISSKSLTIYTDKLDQFFETVRDRKFQFSVHREKELYEFSKEKLDIELKLEKRGKDSVLRLNLKNYDFLISDEKVYILIDYKIYEMTRTEAIIDLLELFEIEKEYVIPEDKFNEFASYVLPKIDVFLKLENLPENIAKDAILVNKLATKMYLDLDEKENITLELKFCYGDFEFNVLDKEHIKYVAENGIERNLIDEKNVLTRIFTDGFELVNGKKYFVLKDLDAVYEFLTSKITDYMNDFEILVTEKFKKREIKKPKISSVSVKLNNGLLELDISKLDFDLDEIKDVLKNYNIKKKYYKLKNGDFLSLEQSEDLEFLSEMSNSLDVNFDRVNHGIIKLPVNRSVYLEKLLSKNESINTEKNENFSKLISNIENKSFSEDIKIAEEFKDVLRDYQKTGYRWLKTLENYQFGGILADDMGLGKTLQIIAVLASCIDEKKTSIVVSPSSLVLNWKAEIEKWCPKIKVCIIKGDAQTRKELINSYHDYDLIITSYDLLKRDVSEYEGKFFKYIIADEAQYIKNFATQNATSLKSLEGEIRFALTGTPIENSVAELWSIFDFIMPGYLYSYSKFKKRFEEPILKMEDNDVLKKLKFLINPFVLRRVKSEVLTELPEKNITIMNNEMTAEQQKIYMSYFMQTKKEVAAQIDEKGFEKSKFKILMLLTRLRQICCHPNLFIENYKGESGKLNQCMDIITDAIDAGHKILLFSSYTSMFEIIEKKLKKNKIEYYKLTGSTPVSQRVEMVEKFNKNPEVKIFLISLKAGGTGLNLTGADVVIHYDPWWNLSAENQATDRAYRIGQKNSVQVYKLITADSIEEKINKLQEKKSKLSEQLLSTEETFINKFSKEEIMELFEE